MTFSTSAQRSLVQLEAVDSKSGLVNVIIDTPRGSRCKYEYDEDKDLFRLSKLPPLGTTSPYAFGFVSSTKGEDGDPLDVLVLLEKNSGKGPASSR